MRKLGVSVATIFVLLIVAVLAGPGFVDWNRYKEEITNQAVALTGRKLTIEGDLSLQILPRPSFSAKGVAFENALGGSQPSMVRLEELGVAIAIFPLLSGSLQVEEVMLRKPVVYIEKLPNGQGNWELSPRSAPEKKITDPSTDNVLGVEPPLGSDNSRSFLEDISLERFEVVEGTLVYLDTASGTREVFEDVNAEIVAGSLKGPFAMAGDLLLRGQRTEIEIDLGQFAQEGATAINAGIRLPDSQAKLKFTGFVSRHVNDLSYKGKFQGDGEDLGALLAELMQTNITTKANGDFEFTAALQGDQSELKVEDIVFRVGSQKITGGISGTLTGTPSLELVLASPRVNLDDILSFDESIAPAAKEVTRKTGQGSGTNKETSSSQVPEKRSWPVLPSDMRVSAQLVVNDVIFKKQLMREFVIQSKVEKGILHIDRFSAFLPNGGQLSLVGSYSDQNLSGQINARTEDLRGVLNWLEVETPTVPNDRLRRLEGKVKFSATPQALTLNPVSLTLDVTHFDGAATIALRDRVGVGARFVVDRIDLDAYQTQDLSGQTQSPVADPAITAGEENPQPTEIQKNKPGKSKPLKILDSFDANVDISVTEAKYNGLVFKGVNLDATLQQGNLEIRNGSLDDLLGSSVSFSGDFSGITSELQADATVIASVKDLPALLAATGVAAGQDIPDLGPLEVSGSIKGTLEDVTLDILGSALGGGYQLQGRLDPGNSNIYEGLLALDHPDTAQLIRRLDPGAAVNHNWGRMKARALVKLGQSRLELSELDGTVAETKIQGTVLADLGDQKTKIKVNLLTGLLDLDRLLPQKTQGGASGNASGGGSPASAGLNRRWSQSAIDVTLLSSADVELSLIADGLLQDGLRLDQVQLKATLENSVLNISEFTSQVYGGALSLTGVIERQGQDNALAAQLEIDGQNIESNDLFRSTADFKRISGPLSFKASLVSFGASEADLVQSLAGSGSLEGLLKARVKDQEVLGGALLGALGSKVPEISGVGDATSTLLQSFAGQPANLSGTYTIGNGVVVTRDLRLDGNNASVFSAAQVDLPAWLIDSQSDLFRTGDDPTKPFMTVLLTGPLDNPNPRVKGLFLQSKSGNNILQQLLGGESSQTEEPTAEPTGGGAEEPAPENTDKKETKKKKTRELIKGILNDLGG
ncbi:AsmA family protein [Kiloniella laminariae]|uniref:AsmA family protein n=1 Tax=Kiloniella laminariae TaxID=454162 RepID=A0ABT4LI50_9PROT|nr:AsmA family protein [Kiloniella laminariae]MCZ4280778.1 AsmA family protein [Kiloniella laminariae]